MYTVKYQGFLGPVLRDFDTYDRAVQWARQVGKIDQATIGPSDAMHNPKPPYPFCRHPDKCIAAHRCMSDICCAD